MSSQGYVRFPTIHQEQIVFVSEDDLWLVSSNGGRAERLTAGVSRASRPHFSPNGQHLAFVGREEGPGEVYVMPASGGPAQRLTYDADLCLVLGWSPSGEHILYASSKEHYADQFKQIYEISYQGGPSQRVPVGRANAISYGPQGGIVIGRTIDEPAHWKRYRGGLVGHLWCKVTGHGLFKRLLNLQGNIADPCWVGERIYFLSDHEGIANIYSCTPTGEDVRRHSDLQSFYARHLSTDGHRLVFHAGADLYLFDPQLDHVRQLDITVPGQRTQLNRKFVSASRYLDTLALHPQGHAIAVTTRGKAFSMSNWEGAVLQHGEQDGVRYRFLEWLNDGQRLIAICDAPGKEALVVFDPTAGNDGVRMYDVDFGRCVELCISPTDRDDIVAIANHRHEVIIVSLKDGASAVLDHSDYDRISDLAWSPDGRWLAYSYAITGQRTAIKVGDMENGQTHIVTNPVLSDSSPSFDPEGKYLYFLSKRIFHPIRDKLQFDYGFPRGVLPYVITLRNDLASPFIIESKLVKEAAKHREVREETKKAEETEEVEPEGEKGETALEEHEKKEEGEEKNTSLIIDFEGIIERAQPFPVKEARYDAIRGIKGKALFISFPVEGRHPLGQHNQTPKGTIEWYDFELQKTERFVDGVDHFELSRDSKTLIYSSRFRWRALKAGEKPPRTESEQSNKETGWLDLARMKVSVQPSAEWKQMFAEAWRLQREQFWTEDMSGVDWDAVYAQYAPLVERVSSRSELSDLIRELQGELGTSHANERRGDYRRGDYYRQGFLGVDWAYDATTQRYRIAHIVRGDPSEEYGTSPFTLPGLHVHEGDAVLGINGQQVGSQRSPQELLVNQADQEVQLLIESAENKETHIITVNTLPYEGTIRYREWVERNRRLVYKLSEGRVGYIHIPDMGAEGFAEFHRGYLMEYDYPALVIDVRWNHGGHVSELLLEKLARKRLGYGFSRWGQPEPYPEESPRGPMVALANEHTSSNGDIFSHCFKLMKLGPLIGTRTWGGVIGIAPRHQLVDNTTTTQPEYANWFMDVGWNIENYGTDPDIEVDVTPEDYVNSIDPQLERAVAEALRIAATYPTLEPNPGEKPRRGR